MRVSSPACTFRRAYNSPTFDLFHPTPGVVLATEEVRICSPAWLQRRQGRANRCPQTSLTCTGVFTGPDGHPPNNTRDARIHGHIAGRLFAHVMVAHALLKGHGPSPCGERYGKRHARRVFYPSLHPAVFFYQRRLLHNLGCEQFRQVVAGAMLQTSEQVHGDLHILPVRHLHGAGPSQDPSAKGRHRLCTLDVR